MRVCVIGGNRYHGKLLVQALAARGDAVAVLNRNRYPCDLPPGCQHVIADRNDGDVLAAALDGERFDAVYDNNAYTVAQVDLLADALGERVDHYIFTSSVAVYLKRTSPAPLAEDTADGVKDADYPAHVLPYALGKLTAETAVRRRFPDRHTIVRLGNVFGGEDIAGKLRYFERRLEENGRLLLDEGLHPFSPIYVADAARLFSLLSQQPKARGRIFNMAAPVPMAVPEFLALALGEERLAGRIAYAPPERIAACGIRCPVAWGPSMDVSALLQALGGYAFTPAATWLREGLLWERVHAADRENQPDQIEQRGLEARCLAALAHG